MPAVSVIEKVLARAKVDVTAPPPGVAVEVAVIVQVVVFDCATAIAEIFVNVKSVPSVVDKVAQFMASSPVTVKVIAWVLAVAEARAKVKVGAVVSATVAGVEALPVDPDVAAAVVVVEVVAGVSATVVEVTATVVTTCNGVVVGGVVTATPTTEFVAFLLFVAFVTV